VADGSSPSPVADAVPVQDVSVGSLAQNFVKGVGDTVIGLTAGTAQNVADIARITASLVFNELGVASYNRLTDSNRPKWYPELHGPTAQAYQDGTSQAELILSNTPILNVGVMTYHAASSAMQGDWNAVARQAGGVAGGFAVGKGVQKYGEHGVTIADIGGPKAGPLARQRGAVGLKLVGPEDVAGPPPEGVVYLRTDRFGGIKQYGGQTKSEARFIERQAEHARAHPEADFEYSMVRRAKPGEQLDIAEHEFIQELTGGVAARKSTLVSNLKDPVGARRRAEFGLPEPRRDP
jgi:hypothetical protein